MPRLFSYGTLQQADVQLATFGRLLAGTPDALLGHVQEMVAIDDPDVVRTSGKRHHPIVRSTDDRNARVAGTVFEVSDEELERADRYEVSAYRRVAATLASGGTAWAYVDAGDSGEGGGDAGAIRDPDTLLARMQPIVNPGRYAFVALAPGATIDPAIVIASIREPEGLSAVVSEPDARELGLPVAFIAAWITLSVHSDLAAIGLTAAVSTALAKAGIACNVVAGTRHDHVFVPADQADAALATLLALQQSTPRP